MAGMVQHWRGLMAFVSASGIAACGCGDAGGASAVDRDAVRASTTEPPSEVHVRIPLANDLPGWGREIPYAELCSYEGSCPTFEESLELTNCSLGTFGPELLSSLRTQIVTGCGLIAVHRPSSGSYWYEADGSRLVAVGDWSGRDSGYSVWAATRSIECEADEQTICSMCDDGYPVCGDPSTWRPVPPPE